MLKSQNCRDHTTGEECELCEAGYTGDATQGTSNDCRPDGSRPPSTCACDPRGSARTECPDGRNCMCKANCEGSRCDQCKSGHFGLTHENPQGCLTCFCSGLTHQCISAKLYISQITMQVINSQHGFTLSERNGIQVPNLRINIGQNEISYSYPSTPARSPKLYWSLPPAFTGNKVRFHSVFIRAILAKNSLQITSYGGFLNVTQQYEERQGALGQRFTETDIIFTSGRITLGFSLSSPIPPGQPVVITRFKIKLFLSS